jgi:hypothetical protein
MLSNSKLKIKSAYICGVIDGEASFGISVKPHNTAKYGWVIDPKFSITLDKNAEHVLRAIQDILGCGRVTEKSGQENCKLFIEQSRRNLMEKVIGFLERYPLEIKQKSYNHFKNVVMRLEKKEHETPEGFIRLAAYATSHTDAKGTRKYTIQDVLKTMKNKPANAEKLIHEELSTI